jgi:hypothetical protein
MPAHQYRILQTMELIHRDPDLTQADLIITR